ncbi:MAG: DegT/DnrJ/EryC1/StrS family aminotransferase, partial [Gammaproteobacteria bacterium]
DERRREIWARYHEAFSALENLQLLRRPAVPEGCRHNAHIYYLKLPSTDAAVRFAERMKAQGVSASSHYVPLHTSPGGRRYGTFVGVDRFTTQESERLVRLPLWFNMTDEEVGVVVEAATEAVRAHA